MDKGIHFTLQEMVGELQKIRDLKDHCEQISQENKPLRELCREEEMAEPDYAKVYAEAEALVDKQVRFSWDQMASLLDAARVLNETKDALKHEHERLKVLVENRVAEELDYYDSQRRPKTMPAGKDGLVL